MKIAYITLHKVRNYGSVLQAYATFRVFKKLGHDPVLIDYCSPRFVEKHRVDDEFSRFNHPKKNNPLIKTLFYTVMSYSIKRQRRVFDGFLADKVSRTKPYFDIEELRADAPEADVYCTGSDQVWNILGNRFFERPFYLDFGKDSVRKIAFSASFGRSEITEEEREKGCPLLLCYDAIGVREMSGLSILEDMGVRNFANTLDPTLVLEEEEWTALTKEKSPFKKKYILIYEFNKTSNLGTYARELSKKTGLPIKRVTYWYHERHKGEECVVRPSMEGFLNLIRHAEYVITNSFHATVFSTVFRKKFAAVYPEFCGVRLEDYLRLTGMLDRHIYDPANIGSIEHDIDYDRVYTKIAEEREKTLRFLQKGINGGE